MSDTHRHAAAQAAVYCTALLAGAALIAVGHVSTDEAALWIAPLLMAYEQRPTPAA